MTEAQAWYNPLEYSPRPASRNLGLSSNSDLAARASSGDKFAKAELVRRARVHEEAYQNWQNTNG
ncbi:hypothetical protein OOJ09_12880 [Mesorhizobium qingshengii]|uniref:Uncharacterized protein n=1 Tax=Mesorhizobium qingshengii TaxID=1165689 RepID=A0ABT4QU13_9HYPH|nr:hypothetical protein [Mesorhizobium qingshengii]MCZ8545081.1 hypothetical protein [Mesorhizobium qingshengii]